MGPKYVFSTRYILLSIVWILVVVLTFEVFLRIFFYKSPTTYVNYPEWGERPAKGSVLVSGHEGFGIVNFSDDGEIATPYSGGKSILVLGDSYTAAIQVNDEDNFVSIAESFLRDKSFMVDLHNLGYEEQSLPDYIYSANFLLERYTPEILVMQITKYDFEYAESFNPDRKNHFKFNQEESLEVVHNPEPNQKNRLLSMLLAIKRRSSLLGMGYNRLYLFQNLRKQEKLASAAPQEPNIKQEGDTAGNQDYLKLQFQALRTAYPDIPVIFVLIHSPKIGQNGILTYDPAFDDIIEIINNNPDYHLVDPQAEFIRLFYSGKYALGFVNTRPMYGHLNVNGHMELGKLLAEKIETIMQ